MSLIGPMPWLYCSAATAPVTIADMPLPLKQCKNSVAGLHVPGYSPEQVEEVRLVVRLLPIFFTTILYWTVYAQMGTFFIMQARRPLASRTLCMTFSRSAGQQAIGMSCSGVRWPVCSRSSGHARASRL